MHTETDAEALAWGVTPTPAISARLTALATQLEGVDGIVSVLVGDTIRIALTPDAFHERFEGRTCSDVWEDENGNILTIPADGIEWRCFVPNAVAAV